jgi:hypothetical protein
LLFASGNRYSFSQRLPWPIVRKSASFLQHETNGILLPGARVRRASQYNELDAEGCVSYDFSPPNQQSRLSSVRRRQDA